MWREFSGQISGQRLTEFLSISNPFWSFPYAENPASDFFPFLKLEPVWLQLQSMFQKFLPFPIIQSTCLKDQTYQATLTRSANGVVSSCIQSNKSSMETRPPCRVRLVRSPKHDSMYEGRSQIGFSLMKVSSICFVVTTDALC